MNSSEKPKRKKPMSTVIQVGIYLFFILSFILSSEYINKPFKITEKLRLSQEIVWEENEKKFTWQSSKNGDAQAVIIQNPTNRNIIVKCLFEDTKLKGDISRILANNEGAVDGKIFTQERANGIKLEDHVVLSFINIKKKSIFPLLFLTKGSIHQPKIEITTNDYPKAKEIREQRIYSSFQVVVFCILSAVVAMMVMVLVFENKYIEWMRNMLTNPKNFRRFSELIK